MNFSLIIPIAADKEEYHSEMPYVFSLNRKGISLCINAILGLDLKAFSNIYFTILKSHDKLYNIKEMLELQLRRLQINAKVVVLEKPTRSQAETIFKTIQLENITGSIFIKDADNYFSCEIIPQNGVTIYPLENLNMVNPQHKSYVAVDDMFYVTNIIEKKIISHYFNAGGICFENSVDFCNYYLKLSELNDFFYVSHIIYAMLLDKKIFRPIEVKDYKDWGDIKSYQFSLSNE